MFTIKFDNVIATTDPTAKREETPFLRGTVVLTEEGFEAMKSARIRVYGDNNPEIMAHAGKWVVADAAITDRIETDKGKSSFTLNDVVVTKFLGDKESAALAKELSRAQLAHLMSAPARNVKLGAAADAAAAPAQSLVTAGGDEL